MHGGVMGLEGIVKKAFSSCSSAARIATNYPKVVGIAAASFSVAFSDTAPYCLGIGVAVYGITSVINEYVFGNREPVACSKDAGLIKKAEQFVFNNPLPFATAYGIAAAAFFGLSQYKSPDFGFLDALNVFGSMHFVLASSFLYLRKYNESFIQAYQKLKSGRPVVKSWDYVLENPLIPAVSVGSVVCASLFADSFFGLKNMPVFTLEFIALCSMDSAFAAYSLGAISAGLFHSSSFRILKENMKLYWHSAMKNYKKAESACRELIEISESPERRSSYHLRLANMYFKQRKFDYGLLSIQKVLSTSKEKNARKTPMDLVRDFVLPDKMVDFFWQQMIADNSSGGAVRHLNLAAYDFKRRNFDKALDNLDSAVQQGGGKIRIGIIKAAALEYVDAGKADAAWQDIVDEIIVTYKEDFKQVSFTSKEVLKLSFDELLANTFVFARDQDIGALRQEHDISRFVFSCYDDPLVVPKQYYFDVVDDKAYSVSSYLPGSPLSRCEITDADILGSLQAYFDFCLRTTAGKEKMQDFSADVPVLDYRNIFRDKFLDRLPADEKKRKILKHCFFPVIRKLETRQRYFIHGNFHPGNVIKGPSNNYCTIDFGDACFANICFGVEQLLGHHLVDAKKQRIYEEVCSFSGSCSRDIFLEDCALSSAFVASHLLGRSIYYKEGPALHYKNNLVDSAVFLADNFVSADGKKQLLDFAGEIQDLDVE